MKNGLLIGIFGLWAGSASASPIMVPLEGCVFLSEIMTPLVWSAGGEWMRHASFHGAEDNCEATTSNPQTWLQAGEGNSWSFDPQSISSQDCYGRIQFDFARYTPNGEIEVATALVVRLDCSGTGSGSPGKAQELPEPTKLPTPEPSAFWLTSFGVGIFLACRRLA
jgi:hypothetical protein